MTAVRRVAAAGLASLTALVLMTVPAMAATKSTAPKRPATPAAPAKAAAALPPQIYQLNPIKVNPTVLPNIMILGQHLTPTTHRAGGRPAGDDRAGSRCESPAHEAARELGTGFLLGRRNERSRHRPGE